ncbi:hypothetical protein LINPERHAP1_LOCUS18522 [Linum perenne]
MEQERPGCEVKADPNIISRCKTLKAKFLALHELRGLSGSGWDDTKKMVIVDETSYADYVAKHSHCAKLNRVPFLLMMGWQRYSTRFEQLVKVLLGWKNWRNDVLPSRYKRT